MKANEESLCWSEIGVWGNRTCKELPLAGSCLQCVRYHQAGHRLFHRESPAEYRAEWSRLLAQEVHEEVAYRKPFFVFRIGASWLGMAVQFLVEAAPVAAIRSLPHRRSEMLLGLTAIRGEILPCVSLHALLGEQAGKAGRFLVVRYREGKWSFPADEVMGVQELAEESAPSLPANLTHADLSFTRGMLECQGQQIGLLDEELLFGTIERRVA